MSVEVCESSFVPCLSVLDEKTATNLILVVELSYEAKPPECRPELSAKGSDDHHSLSCSRCASSGL
eukprot:18871-Eustigmatos_ZCMA.PRE.1